MLLGCSVAQLLRKLIIIIIRTLCQDLQTGLGPRSFQGMIIIITVEVIRHPFCERKHWAAVCLWGLGPDEREPSLSRGNENGTDGIRTRNFRRDRAVL